MQIIQPDVTAAKKLALALTHGRGDVTVLFGPRYATHRQRLIELLTGVKRPKLACGYHAMIDEFAKAAKAPCECNATRENAIAEWCKGGAV